MRDVTLRDAAVSIPPRIVITGLVFHLHRAAHHELAPRSVRFIDDRADPWVTLDIGPPGAEFTRGEPKASVLGNEPNRHDQRHAGAIGCCDPHEVTVLGEK